MDENYTLLGNFEKFWEIFDENSIEKMNFYILLGKVVAKNRAFGNNIIFLRQFFSASGGGGVEPKNTPPPKLRHWLQGNKEEERRTNLEKEEIRQHVSKWDYNNFQVSVDRIKKFNSLRQKTGLYLQLTSSGKLAICNYH